jgi:PhnB protein
MLSPMPHSQRNDMSSKKYIPTGYHAVNAYLTVKGCAAAIDFYKRAFDAVEVMRLEMGPDVIGHAEIVIRDTRVMLSDEFPEMGIRSPATLGGASGYLMIYVPDCDQATEKVVTAGAKLLRPPTNEFFGDRVAQVEDPFGHRWALHTMIEELTPDEIKARMAQHYGQ